MKKRKVNLPSKALLIGLIIFLALVFIMGYIWNILTTSDYFRVREVLTRETYGIDLSYLKGENIFKLNLADESAKIIRNCPDCLRVRLARVIPDRLYIEFIKRRPLALIKDERYLAVDSSFVIFYPSKTPEDSELPVINGLEKKFVNPRPGTRCDFKELTIALSSIKEAQKNPLLRGHRISKINFEDLDNITIEIPLTQPGNLYSNGKAIKKSEDLIVKIGEGNIRDRVVIMAGLINQEKNNLGNIKYIDLRFKEPVIKFKDVK
jgi:cell division septal protein FtsQ